MSDAVIASGVVAVAVFGFAPQNNAMLTAGAERTFKPVLDGMILSICGWLSLFALALGVLHLLPQWASGTAMVLASLLLALSGLTRYMANPGNPLQQEAGSVRPALPLQHLRNPESWAVAFFLAGSALSGSMTLAAAFAGRLPVPDLRLAPASSRLGFRHPDVRRGNRLAGAGRLIRVSPPRAPRGRYRHADQGSARTSRRPDRLPRKAPRSPSPAPTGRRQRRCNRQTAATIRRSRAET